MLEKSIGSCPEFRKLRPVQEDEGRGSPPADITVNAKILLLDWSLRRGITVSVPGHPVFPRPNPLA